MGFSIYIVYTNNYMQKNGKNFEAYKIRTLRLSEKTWRKLIDIKKKSGENWERFIIKLIK